MPWFIAVDWSLGMLRLLKNEPNNFFQVAKKTVQNLLSNISLTHPNEPICLFIPTEDDDMMCTEFTANFHLLELAIEKFPSPEFVDFSKKPFCRILVNAIRSHLLKFNESHHFRLIVITDGDNGDFIDDEELTPLEVDVDICTEITCIVLSLSDKQISPELTQLTNCFADNLLLELETTGSTEALAQAVIKSQTCESLVPGYLACGHLFAKVNLVPPPCFRHRQGMDASRLQLFIEVFGFLNSTDISHPPIQSRHSIISASDCGKELLTMLLTSLTSLVAMVNVYLQPPLKGLQPPTVLKLNEGEEASDTIVYPDSRELITHGFISRFNSKRECLILSLFPEDCKSLPWIGQFTLLAPVTDFAGSLPYNDAENLTPFPVRETDQLSYKTPSSDSTDFQYINWIHAPNGPTNDIAKVLRLSKRLPDKASLFFKELRRVKSAALALGWPELLTNLRDLIKENVQPTVNQSHLETIAQILSLPTGLVIGTN